MVIAPARGEAQEMNLWLVTPAPFAEQHMNLQTEPREKRQRLIQCEGLQANRFLAIG